MDKWTPATEGTGFELSEILQPLKPFRDRINIISDLSHPQAYGGGSATSNHNRSAATFLSGAHAELGPAGAPGHHAWTSSRRSTSDRTRRCPRSS